ncbi:MAG: hypothetical protein Q4C59_09875 [Lachnospiraceae bacterium]|nr:hypothetical protein [Lachnospiraceae bacterium]
MKASINSTKKDKRSKGIEKLKHLDDTHPRLAFAARTAGFYFLMMVLFLYFMMANLSTAPKFVYTQF